MDTTNPDTALPDHHEERMRHVSAYLLLSLTTAAVCLTGCADPNPTFVFDAATPAKEGGIGGSGVDAGTKKTDGGTDGARDGGIGQ
jgi:hypothetical protein